jgi:hypothetical protein
LAAWDELVAASSKNDVRISLSLKHQIQILALGIRRHKRPMLLGGHLGILVDVSTLAKLDL